MHACTHASMHARTPHHTTPHHTTPHHRPWAAIAAGTAAAVTALVASFISLTALHHATRICIHPCMHRRVGLASEHQLCAHDLLSHLLQAHVRQPHLLQAHVRQPHLIPGTHHQAPSPPHTRCGRRRQALENMAEEPSPAQSTTPS